MSKVIFLKITSYIGISPGASHFYGELIPQDRSDSVNLRYVLSERRATRINRDIKHNSPGDYDLMKVYPGQFYGGFYSEEEIIRLAKREWRDRFPEAEMLVLGDRSSAEPQLVLEGPKKDKETINRWFEKCEYLNWDYDNPLVEEITEDFWKYWCEFWNE